MYSPPLRDVIGNDAHGGSLCRDGSRTTTTQSRSRSLRHNRTHIIECVCVPCICVSRTIVQLLPRLDNRNQIAQWTSLAHKHPSHLRDAMPTHSHYIRHSSSSAGLGLRRRSPPPPPLTVPVQRPPCRTPALPGGQQNAVGIDCGRTGCRRCAGDATRLGFGGALLVAQIFHATCHHNRRRLRSETGQADQVLVVLVVVVVVVAVAKECVI